MVDELSDVYNDVYIMKMVRKQIYLTREQDERLKQLAAEYGQPEAEVVRTALDAFAVAAYQQHDEGGRWLREAAVMDYVTGDITSDKDTRTRAAGNIRSRLAAKAWQEELAFMKSLRAQGRGGTIERFNRDELYEERLAKILPRH